MTTKRIAWIDNAKGVGIILVVLGHVLPGFFYMGLISNIETHTDFYKTICELIASFHMPLFFLLAGIVLHTKRDDSWSSFAQKKTIHLLYPYLVWSAIQNLLRPLYYHNFNWRQYLIDFICPTYQFWFLPALLIITLSVSLALYSSTWRLMLIPIALTCSLLPYFGITGKMVVYFVTGFVLRSHSLEKITAPKYTMFYILIFLLSFFINKYHPIKSYQITIIFSWMIALSGCFATIGICRLFPSWKVFIFNRLGQLSLHIYLTHIILIGIARAIFLKMGISNIPLLAILITVAAILSSIWLSKIDWLFQLPGRFYGNLILKK
jgi:fucose 4-O-acetylase-like acetyltransferase